MQGNLPGGAVIQALAKLKADVVETKPLPDVPQSVVGWTTLERALQRAAEIGRAGLLRAQEADKARRAKEAPALMVTRAKLGLVLASSWFGARWRPLLSVALFSLGMGAGAQSLSVSPFGGWSIDPVEFATAVALMGVAALLLTRRV